MNLLTREGMAAAIAEATYNNDPVLPGPRIDARPRLRSLAAEFVRQLAALANQDDLPQEQELREWYAAQDAARLLAEELG